jgi:ParB/RepB/Spo0J family partition protein
MTPNVCGYVVLPVNSIRLPTLPALGAGSLDESEVAACAETLRLHGEMAHPLTVRTVAAGGYEVVDGALRLRAAERLGWASVPCRVRDLSDEQAVLVSVLLDATRRKPPADLRRAWAIADTLDLLGLRPVEFATISRYNNGEISEARRFVRAFPRDVVEAWAAEHDAPIDAVAATSRDVLRRLVKEPDDARRLELLVSVAHGPLNGAAAAAGDAIRVDVAAVRRLSLRARLRLALRLLRVLFPTPAPTSRIFAGVRAANSAAYRAAARLRAASRFIRRRPRGDGKGRRSRQPKRWTWWE